MKKLILAFTALLMFTPMAWGQMEDLVDCEAILIDVQTLSDSEAVAQEASGDPKPFTLDESLSRIQCRQPKLYDDTVEDYVPNPYIEKPKHLVGVNSPDFKLKGDASDITVILQRIARGVAMLAGALAVFFIVNSSFGLVIGLGDADGLSKAKKAMTWSVVGLLAVIFAYVLVKTVISIAFSGEIF